MDFQIQCDDFDRFEPTAEDWVENEEVELFEDEEEEDFSEILSIFQPDFLGLVDTLNGYRV